MFHEGMFYYVFLVCAFVGTEATVKRFDVHVSHDVSLYVVLLRGGVRAKPALMYDGLHGEVC